MPQNKKKQTKNTQHHFKEIKLLLHILADFFPKEK